MKEKGKSKQKDYSLPKVGFGMDRLTFEYTYKDLSLTAILWNLKSSASVKERGNRYVFVNRGV